MTIPFIALSVIACEGRRDLLEPYSNDVDLIVQRSEAEPNRACELTASGGGQKRLEIAGDFGRRNEPESLDWEIVGPSDWSARNVSSQFTVGIGGESSHRWLTENGEIQAKVLWWDERPGDGRDSNITIIDPAGRIYTGECRNLAVQAMDTPS